MQVPIDFYSALLDSGSVIVVILLFSLLIFASRVRAIYPDIGVGTRRALMAYAMAGIGMAIATIVGMMPDLRFLITGAGALFLGAIAIIRSYEYYFFAGSFSRSMNSVDVASRRNTIFSIFDTSTL